MPSATISTSEGLADFNSRITAALTEHSGVITLTGGGDMPSTPIDLNEVVDILIEGGTTLKVTPDPADLEATTSGAVRFVSGGSGTITFTGGSKIDAGGAHNGIVQVSGAGDVVLVSPEVVNASHKQINANGNMEVTDGAVSSDADGSEDGVAPVGVLSDWEAGISDTMTIHGLRIGLFTSSTQGQLVKIARVVTSRLTNIQTPVLDADTVFTFVVAEEIDYAIIKDSTLPRRVSHFPDGTGGADLSANVVVYSNTTFGNWTDDPLLLMDHLLARIVVFVNCIFLNPGTKMIDDETPAGDLASRVFIGCKFNTASATTLISHDDGASTLTGRIRHADCTFETTGSGSWTKPADWDASEITLPAGYDLANIAEIFV